MSLIEKIKPKQDLVSCEQSIDKMIRHLKLIKNDLTCDRNPEEFALASLGIRMDGFNSLNKVFQDYIAELQNQ